MEGRVKYFAEVHALHTFATQGWTNGRRGRGLPGADYELDDLIFLYRLLSHCDVYGWYGWGMRTSEARDAVRRNKFFRPDIKLSWSQQHFRDALEGCTMTSHVTSALVSSRTCGIEKVQMRRLAT